MIEPAQFANLPNKEKIMEVANDVINNLETHRIIPESNVFVSFDKTIWDKHRQGSDNLWDKLPFLMEKCECCALGACLLSFCRASGDFRPKGDFQEYFDEDDKEGFFIESEFTIQQIAPLFGMRMTQMIEVAYEKGCGYYLSHCDDLEETEEIDGSKWDNCILNKDEYDACVNFGENSALWHPYARMRAIMQNIIDNKGEFKPAA